MNSKEIRGTIFDIRRFSTHDGGGIRTTVFLKGCPLSCVWCHNPEGIQVTPRPLHFPNKCIRCGICVGRSGNGGIVMTDRHKHIKLHTDKHENWDQMIEECPAGALAWDSKNFAVDEAYEEIIRDEAFFKHGGGVTLSGGEPLLQADFSIALLKKLRENGIHTAIETALYMESSILESVLPFLDHIYADLKLLDSEEHRRYTGVSNERIKTNLRFLLESDKAAQVTVRTPMIPKITANEENIAGISRFLSAIYPKVSYELLNYNPLAEAKYHLVDKEYFLKENPGKFSLEAMERFATIAIRNGIKKEYLIMEP